MPANKSAFLRYRIIDGCLTNKLCAYPTIEDIQEKIEEQLDGEISISMINKDLAEMKRIYNAPIAYSRGNKGYHYTQPEFSIKEFPLTREEIDALDFSTALLSHLRGTQLLKRFEDAVNKVIAGYRISKVIGKSEKYLIQTEEPVSTEGTQWLERILIAITHKTVLSITYHPFEREAKVHIFSPYLLKEYRNRWYVIGHSDRIDNTIVLALDRIEALEEASQKFVSDDSFSPEDYFEYSFGITQVHDATPAKVVLSFTKLQALYILRHPLHHSQRKRSENDNEVQIELTVYMSAELVMTILGYGDQVKVIEPQSLREKIKNIVTNVLSELNSTKLEKQPFSMDF
jgi:predicted DNA-binding transcriptional regulator YafY